jgi:hypothetical protein
VEEKKQANEEHLRLVEEERKLFLMDTSHMDERQKEYINLARDEVLAKKRLLLATMNTPTVGMFGGGMAGMPMFGGGMAGMGGMDAMGGMPVMVAMGGMAGMGGMSGMGGYGGMAGYGGVSGWTMGASVSGVYGAMGAPPGGFVASLDFTIPPSTQDVDEEEAKEGDDLENAEV